MDKYEIEGRALMSLNEDTQAAYEQYRTTFSEQCHELFDLGLREQERRTEEIRLYEETVNKGKEDAQKEAQLSVINLKKLVKLGPLILYLPTPPTFPFSPIFPLTTHLLLSLLISPANTLLFLLLHPIFPLLPLHIQFSLFTYPHFPYFLLPHFPYFPSCHFLSLPLLPLISHNFSCFFFHHFALFLLRNPFFLNFSHFTYFPSRCFHYYLNFNFTHFSSFFLNHLSLSSLPVNTPLPLNYFPTRYFPALSNPSFSVTSPSPHFFYFPSPHFTYFPSPNLLSLSLILPLHSLPLPLFSTV